jgi:chromosome segregation ATPase
LKVTLKETTEQFAKVEAEERHRIEEARKQKEQRMNDLYQKLVEMDMQLFQEETNRNNIHEAIRQAEVDEDNLRNRYQTFKGLRQSQKNATHQLEVTQQTAEEWRARVETSKKDLDELRQMLALTVNRNRAPRSNLATLKPYFDEVAEAQALNERRNQLQSQLQRLQRQRSAKNLENSGEITMT